MELRTVMPDEPLGDLGDWYGWPEGRSWLRCMMLTTLDGAARGSDGMSGSLSSSSDQQVFSEVRRFAHAILVGAETVRTEDYQAVRAVPQDEDRRVELGMLPAPVLVVVSASLDLPFDSAAFRESDNRPIVVTTEEARLDRQVRAADCCDVITMPGDSVDPYELIAAIAYRGLTRIVCEGGPHLLSELSRAGLVDEADITIAPLLAGGGQVAIGRPIPEPVHFALASVIEQDGWLYTRYVRRG
jgi:riboflavin biosynthesis pyrimidine reductase